MAAFYRDELDNFYQSLKASQNKSMFASFNLLKLNRTSPEEELPNRGRVSNLFRPLRISLTLLGRWPFQLENYHGAEEEQIITHQHHDSISPIEPDLAWMEKKSSKIPVQNHLHHQHHYTASMKWSLAWIYFIVTTLFLSIVLILSILGFCDVFLDWRLFAVSSWDEEEQRNIKSNLVAFVLVWSCLLHSSISSVSFIINRKKIAKFLNYWNYAVDSMSIDFSTTGIKRYVLINHIAFLGFLLVIYIAYKILYLNLVRGGALLVGALTCRPFIFLFDSTRDLFGIRIFGVVTILYAVYSSRAFLLIFSFKIKLLRHAFKVWNSRLKSILKSSSTSPKDEKLRCEKAFSDYKILLKLVRLTDHVFGMVLQSYYGSQLLNMCFELYYLAQSGTYNKSWMDIVAALIILIQNLYIFFTVSLDAAYVNEEATKGLEILRRSGISPSDSIYIKYLVTNMQIVFSQKVVLTGGKYFNVDRPFIVTVLGAVFTYFVIVLQVGPSLHKKIEDNISSA